MRTGAGEQVVVVLLLLLLLLLMLLMLMLLAAPIQTLQVLRRLGRHSRVKQVVIRRGHGATHCHNLPLWGSVAEGRSLVGKQRYTFLLQ